MSASQSTKFDRIWELIRKYQNSLILSNEGDSITCSNTKNNSILTELRVFRGFGNVSL